LSKTSQHHEKTIVTWYQVTSHNIDPCSGVALVVVQPNDNGTFVCCKGLAHCCAG
jgi:hypothetical protein